MSEPASDLPLIDEAIISELAELDRAGNDGFLRQIIEVFVQQADPLLDELQTATELGEAERSAALAHKLKGSARTVGAARLGKHCERLEQAARAGELGDGARQVVEIRAAYREARSALEARVR